MADRYSSGPLIAAEPLELLGALAKRVVIEGGRATGVEYIRTQGLRR